ncbi:hypothetical protein EMEDMD4_620059 [Sinorhizobium medicae]|uniref:Uncharacterized protein n=1 Tax=Sinorhizobium medicae TaxID=110321 RepID=A0A508X4Y8_9HYPH|nr:hypothetical protein EMEDMD4_620059 [Sinorhizobium medicae]
MRSRAISNEMGPTNRACQGWDPRFQRPSGRGKASGREAATISAPQLCNAPGHTSAADNLTLMVAVMPSPSSQASPNRLAQMGAIHIRQKHGEKPLPRANRHAQCMRSASVG